MTTDNRIALVSRVIGAASRDLPADAALRRELRSHPGLSPEDSAWISRAVFDFDRWRGWVETGRPTADQIRQALEIADAYRFRPDTFSDDELCRRAVPEWTSQHTEVTAAWIRSIQIEPVLWLRAKRMHEPDLARSLTPVRQGVLPHALAYEGGDDLFQRPEFQAGWFEIQDIASQAVGCLCRPQAGETWWDACAGEGGKTLHLSDLMANRGLIWASDRAAWRLKVLRRRAARAGCFNYRAKSWDGSARLPTRTRFDGVLVDAPCSGLGTWGRNPHARWTTVTHDITELSRIQRQLLEHAAPAVKEGGRLIYAVCTITREETDQVIRQFEEQHPDFKPDPMNHPFLDGVEGPALQMRSQDTGGNDMFLAAWRRS